MYHIYLLVIFSSFLSAISISGNVIDSETNNPLENVNIVIDDLHLGTTSNKDGNFQIDNLESGDHQLFFSMALL